jgi:hypothetical protein
LKQIVKWERIISINEHDKLMLLINILIHFMMQSNLDYKCKALHKKSKALIFNLHQINLFFISKIWGKILLMDNLGEFFFDLKDAWWWPSWFQKFHKFSVSIDSKKRFFRTIFCIDQKVTKDKKVFLLK